MDAQIEFDEDARRVVIVWGPTASGAAASHHIVSMVQERPELKGWDWVQDLRRTEGDGGVDDANRVAAAFADAPAGRTYTLFVTRDPHFGLWTPAMDLQFADRKHRLALTLEQALADLDQLRGRI
jgi:hypothetical protein